MRPPSAFEFVVLSLAVFRATRFLGWDEWPPIARLRAWAIGEHWVPYVPDAGSEKAEDTGRVDPAQLGLPGKQPTSTVSEVRPAYRRPTLAHLVRCPFCLGAWCTIWIYGLWLLFPSEMFYAAAGMALAGAAGLIAKALDP